MHKWNFRSTTAAVLIGKDDPATALRKTWGQNLAEARIARGLSRQALADKLGVSDQAVGQWERAEVTPRLERQLQIADALDCAHGAIFVSQAA